MFDSPFLARPATIPRASLRKGAGTKGMAILKNIPSPADSQAVELGADILNEDLWPMSSCIIA